jgi:hypothetical protein
MKNQRKPEVSTLSTELRNKLDRSIVHAREAAEVGAKTAIEALAVHHHEPYGHMSRDERKLRNHLRARARQLGDKQNQKGKLEITHLVWECAYEHWHRMLFARFLAENNLLIEPQDKIAISLSEAEELAKESDMDVWVFASRCAQSMLPQIFRPDDPLLQVFFATEYRIKLQRCLDSLPQAVFTTSDAMGWVYQFLQSKRKDEVNLSEVKIGADEISAVTQLFTEPYMVEFLLHNTLGAWWAGRKLAVEDSASAQSEDELRRKLALPGVGWEYLRFVRSSLSKGEVQGEADESWRPAAGTFDGWPKKARDIRILDPCCGSGHFLVAALHHLVPIRMAEEGLSAREAVDAVLHDNLHGLEIDERCCQIAAFALAFAAWTYPKAGGYRPLPDTHIACSGIGPYCSKEQWLRLAEEAATRNGMPENRDLFGAEESLLSAPVKGTLETLYELFAQAPIIGSLINPSDLPADLFHVDYRVVAPLLSAVLQAQETSDETRERTIAAAGMVKAADLLSSGYTLVITNVPYLGRGKQDERMQAFCNQHHNSAKADLSTSFVDRCIQFSAGNGATAVVTPQNWLFLATYREFRKMLLQTCAWEFVTRLGPNAFRDMNWWHATTSLLILSSGAPWPDHVLHGLDVSTRKDQEEKALLLQGCEVSGETSVIQTSTQKGIKSDPDARIVFRVSTIEHQLSDFAVPHTGLQTGDNSHYSFAFWEIPQRTDEWEFFHRTAETTLHYGGRFQILRWEHGSGSLADEPGNRIAGLHCSGFNGVLVHRMNRLPVTLYTGDMFDQNGAVILPKDEENLTAIWCFLSSDQYYEEIRLLDTKTGVTPKTLAAVPFDIDHWRIVAQERCPNGLPEPDSDDATQWLFHGRPEESMAPVQVTVARLLGYRWPAGLDDRIRLSKQARVLVKRCDELLKFADHDGIVCIPSVRGEEPASDRLLTLLSACGLKIDKLRELAGGTDLDEWFRNTFFEQHCKLFHNRPFIWHIWDGRRRDGFHALINYHKLAAGNGKGLQLLENLTYSYLGEWITRQKEGVKRGAGGAEDRLAAALELQKRLIAIIEGEPPFDIFVRWKPIEEQPVGWEPDINDGVRMNIRPFMANDIPGGRKGAGILRWKPNIKWSKDRGKEPCRPQEQYPWFWKDSEFTGDRVNDIHLSINDKQKARK